MRILEIVVAAASAWAALGDDVAEREPVALPHEATVTVQCEMTGKGAFVVHVVPSWAPIGAQRFLDLVNDGFFDGTALFRAVPHFLTQFGISKDMSLNNKWRHRVLQDDPKLGVRIRRGTLAFAGGGKNTRTTQMFVALSDRHWPGLGREPWETPFGYVEPADMEAVWGNLYTGYGDMRPFNKNGVDVGQIWAKGYDYLAANFPEMDYLTYCKVLGEPGLAREAEPRRRPAGPAEGVAAEGSAAEAASDPATGPAKGPAAGAAAKEAPAVAADLRKGQAIGQVEAAGQAPGPLTRALLGVCLLIVGLLLISMCFAPRNIKSA